MNRRVKTYQEFLNEGFFSDSKDKIKNFITNLFSSMKDFFSSVFKSRKITTGLKKGTDTVVYFDKSKGSIASQIKRYYSGTEFGKLNPLSIKTNGSYGVNEDLVNLEFPKASDVRNTDVEGVKDMIRRQYKDNAAGYETHPTFIYGAPGIGKTEIVGQMADELGCDLVYMDIQLMEVTDIQGLPVPQKGPRGQQELEYVRSKNFPTDPDSKGILFLDELPNADMYVLKKLNQFIQQKRIQNYYLPDGWIIVCAGNRQGDHSSIEDFSDNPTLGERFYAINYVPTLEVWIKWAKEQNAKIKSGDIYKSNGKTRRTYVFPEIMNMLENYPEMFYRLDPDVSGHNYPSPRGWVKASASMSSVMRDLKKEKWQDVPLEKFRGPLVSAVGFEGAQTLLEYLEVFSRLSPEDVKKIITNPQGAPLMKDLTDKPAKFFGLADFLSSEVTKIKNDSEKLNGVKNVVEYLMRYETYEYIVAAISKMQKNDPKLITAVGAESKPKDQQDNIRDILNMLKTAKSSIK